jgi:hypothetical protein
LAQQGSPPRRPGRHSAPDPAAGQYGAESYEADPRSADPRSADPRSADPRSAGHQNADPYAADPYAADPYAGDPLGTDPRGAQPYGPPDDPYVPQDPYAPRDDRYGPPDPYAPDPYAPDPYAADPRTPDPYGADPYGADPYGADQYGARQSAPSQAPPRYAPPEQRPEPGRSPGPEAPAAPGRRAASRPGEHPGRVSAWQQGDPFTADDDEADLPPWAGLTIRPARAGGTKARRSDAAGPGAAGPETAGPETAGPETAEPDEAADAGRPPRRRGLGRGRAAAARMRKSRRRVYVYCGSAIVVAVVVAGYLAIHALPKHNPAPTFITTLQPGEFASVPSACRSVSPALLASYLPGKVTKVNPAGTSASYSQCSLTVDHKPVFRVLEVTAQAYQPSAVAAGNGSATDNAVDSYVVAEQALRAPGKKSAVPPAQITPLTGLGTEAFRGVQVIHAGIAVNDLVTVMAREHNLVVTVSLQAQAAGNGYGPADVSTIDAGALAIARAVLTQDTAHAARG